MYSLIEEENRDLPPAGMYALAGSQSELIMVPGMTAVHGESREIITWSVM